MIARLIRTRASRAALDAFMKQLNLADALVPVVKIHIDAYMKGGKIGASEIDQDL